ncbi:MAG: VanZ family protein [Deltaproteobacteria bacterium]|nr:VanZ family protein [Deltaproteobacteria bacterium]
MNFKYLLLSLLITSLIVWLSSIPDRSLPGSGSLSKQIICNLAHIPAHALLTLLWLKSFVGTRLGKHSFEVNSLVLVGLVLFAISDEFHQSFVPGRTASFMDIGLDLIGILCGLAVLKALRTAV